MCLTSGLADLWRSALLRRFGRVELLQHPGLSWPQWRPSSDPAEIAAAQVRATASGLSGQNGALVHHLFSIFSASFSHLFSIFSPSFQHLLATCDLFLPFLVPVVTCDIDSCGKLSDTGPNAPRSVEEVKSNDFEILPFQGALGPNSPVPLVPLSCEDFPRTAGCHQVCH